MKPMRILFVISDLGGGGAEAQLALLLNELPRDRYEPHLCLWRPVSEYSIPADIPVHMIPKESPFDLFRIMAELSRLINRLEPDLIFSQLKYVNLIVGTTLRIFDKKTPWLCRLNNDPKHELTGIYLPWARWALRRADKVVGVSEGVTRALVDYLDLDSSKVEPLANFFNIEQIEQLSKEPFPAAKDDNTFSVVHVGRLTDQKNQKLLLDAFAQFKDEQAELWLIGQGPNEAFLKQYCQKIGIERQVKWLGFKKNPFTWMRAADCLVLSSDYEGFPNVLVQAMICGTPVISTKCPYGPDEIIRHGENGLLVPSGDTAALAEAMAALFRDRDLRGRLSREARQTVVTRYDRSHLTAGYEKNFAEVSRKRVPEFSR